ncbi:MAG: O-antigen ligase family protein [Anaerolineae bacterium]|nr:O-antigen ligase family protein [Anaerolineae bacterium]
MAVEPRVSSSQSISGIRTSAVDQRMGLLLFLGAHILLGVLADSSSMVSTAHGLIIFGIGLYWAATNAPLHKLAYICAYITGIEVLWRMTGATSFGVFHEAGKYYVIFITGLALFRMRVRTIPALPFFYILLLVPAILVTLGMTSAAEARDQISSNFSGPFAIFICAVFFSQAHLSRQQMRTALLALVAGVVSVAAVATYSTITAANITWTTESNFTTSGGFGPNQVSSVLGLGAFAAWFLISHLERDRLLRIILTVLGVWFLGQALLTFSRGGVYNALIPIVVLTLLKAIRERRQIGSLALPVLAALVLVFVLLPQLDTLTEGMLGTRYNKGDLTGRDQIIQLDIQIFLDNPLGVGVGMARDYRVLLADYNTAAHTEYSRLLAEHGILGLFALVLLILMTATNVFRSWHQPLAQSLTLGLCSWALIQFIHAATRIVAPSFCIGLTFATLVDDNELPIT